MGDEDGGLPPEDPTLVADRDDTQMDLDRIQQLVRELDISGGCARVFRQKPGAAEYTYEGELPVDNFNLETIRTVYGGGRYNVRLTAKSGKYVRQLKFSIDPRYVGEMDKQTSPATMTAPTGDNSMFMLMLKMQQEQADRMAQQQQQTMSLMMGMMVEGQKATAQMIGAMMSRPERNVTPSQEPASQILGAVMPLVLANMQGGKTTGMTDMLEGIKLMKELATGQTEKEEKEDVMEKVMRFGAPILQMFMASRQQQVNPVQRANPAQPVALPPQDPQTQAAEQKMKQLLGQLRMVTPMLVKAAKRNSSIESYLDILDDHLDDESHAMLHMFLQREDWVTTLFNDDPGVVANIGWFNNFREMVLNPHPDETEETPQGEGQEKTGPTGLVP